MRGETQWLMAGIWFSAVVGLCFRAHRTLGIRTFGLEGWSYSVEKDFERRMTWIRTASKEVRLMKEPNHNNFCSTVCLPKPMDKFEKRAVDDWN